MINVIKAIDEKLQAQAGEIELKNWEIENMKKEIASLKAQLDKANNEIAVLSVAKQ